MEKMTFEEYREIAKKYEKLMRNVEFEDERLKEIKELLVFHDFFNALMTNTIDMKKDPLDNAEVICKPIREPKLEEYNEFLKYLDLSEYSAKLNENTFKWFEFLEKFKEENKK